MFYDWHSVRNNTAIQKKCVKSSSTHIHFIAYEHGYYIYMEMSPKKVCFKLTCLARSTDTQAWPFDASGGGQSTWKKEAGDHCSSQEGHLSVAAALCTRCFWSGWQELLPVSGLKFTAIKSRAVTDSSYLWIWGAKQCLQLTFSVKVCTFILI